MGRFEARAEAVPADLLQRAGEAEWVAGELHGRGVGEELALAADGGLDEPAKEDADPANGQQQQSEQRQRIAVAAAAAGVEQDPADDGEAEDAEDDADQAEVEPHVAVEDVAELVADDALEFVA